MIKSALKYATLISLVALTTCGNWNLDFDDDFAAAGAKKGVGPFTITFLTGDFPASITLGTAYTGPGDAALAEYDPGDGEWRTYTSKTITRLGDYIAFRGDWRTADGNYYSLFNASFQSTAYTCDFSGAFTAYPNHNWAYREMFRNCTAVTAIRDNPVPVLTGAPGADMFRAMCYGMSGITGGNLNLGTGITFTADNVGVLAYMFSQCTQWTGSVYWGDELITDQITPATRIYTFQGCTSKPNFDTLHLNWK